MESDTGKSNIIKNEIRNIMETIASLKSVEEKIEILNVIKDEISKISPFCNEPVDNVKWVKSEKIVANDYNPNTVAPPEMRLLELSIMNDGYTQPIVVCPEKKENRYIVVDGFHRNRIGKESSEIRERTNGFLPVVIIDKSLNERIASTIRHNRARGVHQIKPMSDVVAELYFTGWSDKRIAKELGMDKDEVLRLKQFTGLGSLFKDREFSKSWI